jgi:Raf kinase inhibitor-like YbhB/YbcL family protein
MLRLLLFILLCIVPLRAQNLFRVDIPGLDQNIVNSMIYKGYGCAGANISPPLQWQNAPMGTHSFAITMHDAQAPTGSGWWHWIVYNISPEIYAIKAGAGSIDADLLPRPARHGINDFGEKGYGGMCPPQAHGLHAYTITIWALDIPALDIPPGAMPALTGFMLGQHAIAKASIIVYFQR